MNKIIRHRTESNPLIALTSFYAFIINFTKQRVNYSKLNEYKKDSLN